MPKFKKTIEELETKFGKWLHLMDSIPEKFEDNVFLQLFKTEEIAKFSREEYQHYEDSLKYYRDLKNSLDTAREEGKIEGKIEIAKNGLKEGYPIEMISKMTGLTEEEIKQLKN